MENLTKQFAAYAPGLGVKVNHAAIVEILLQQLDDDRKSSICLCAVYK